MSLTHIPGTVTGPSGRSAEVDFLIDSGAFYTILPESVWSAIGLEPVRSIKLRLADGTTLSRSMSECRLEVDQGAATTQVVLGDPGDLALLGALFLEELGLMLHPVSRELVPMRLYFPTMTPIEREQP